jgi:hypothetical protein
MAARLNRPREEFGFAFGSNAYVLFDRIEEFAENARTPDDRPALLGSVLAHEIGHIFLGPGAHSPTGLMRAHWQAREYRDSEHGVLLFTGRQGRQIRARIGAALESARLNPDDASEAK